MAHAGGALDGGIPRSRFGHAKVAANGRAVALALGLIQRGKQYWCPSCQPLMRGPQAGLAISDHSFYCVRCGVNGDLIDLVRMALGFDYRQAVEWLAERANAPAAPEGAPAQQPEPSDSRPDGRQAP